MGEGEGEGEGEEKNSNLQQLLKIEIIFKLKKLLAKFLNSFYQQISRTF
jgi:hypothetical protein